jgi:putative two-component system response regulator
MRKTMSLDSRFHLLLNYARQAMGPEVDETVLALAAEAKQRLTTPSPDNAAWYKEAAGTLRGLPDTQGGVARIQCLLDACHFFYVSGQPFEAITPALEAIELSRKLGNRAHLRKSLSLRGILCADTGDITNAVECYSEAIDISRSLEDLDSECMTWVNLGVALFYAAQYQDALMCYEHALRLTDTHPELRKHRPSALSNIALCSLHLEDFARGLKASETALAESVEPKTTGEMLARVLRENNYGRLLLEVNNYEKAQERCAIARKYATASNSVRAEIYAAIIEGLCDVYAGRLDIGLSRLHATLEKARLMRPMLRDALIATVKAHEIIGQPEKALVYLRELMDHTQRSKQESALAHHKMHLEKLSNVSEHDISTKTFEKREAQLREQIAQKDLIRAEAEIEVAFAEKNHARRQLVRSHIEMLERMAVTAELRDDSTGEHSYRVGKLASLLAHKYGCDDDMCFMIEIAGRLHDIGKIGVPDAVLLKPGKLNEAELQVMRTHPIVGAELLSKSETPHVRMAEEVARYHHEWWDGSGYPGHLSGTDVPLSARITALADVFDALTHKRPYKDAWPVELALEEIARQSGTQFDPELASMFVELVKQLQTEHADLDAYLGLAAKNTPFKQARSKIQDALHGGRIVTETTVIETNVDRGSNTRLDLQR